jgi:uncharacterized membrane protein YkoI
MLKDSFSRRSDANTDNRPVNPRRTDAIGTAFATAIATASPGLRHRWPAGARAALATLLLGVCALPVAWAGSKDDHERARAAVQAGEVLPLPTLLERLQRTHPGQVLELELDREDGRWIYEIRLLQPDGQLLKLEVDASTAQVLELKRKDERKARSQQDRQR